MPQIKERKAPKARVKQPKVDREVLKQLLTEHVRAWVKNGKRFTIGHHFNERVGRLEYIHADGSDVTVLSFKRVNQSFWRYDLKVQIGGIDYTVRIKIDTDGRCVRW